MAAGRAVPSRLAGASSGFEQRVIVGLLAVAVLGGAYVVIGRVTRPLPATAGLPVAAPTSVEPVVWVAGESLKVSPEQVPAAKSAVWDAGEIRLYGARQEYVGLQVGRAGAEALSKTAVRVSSLKGPDGAELTASNIDRFQQHYLKVTVPSQFDSGVPVPEAHAGEFPVQLVPLRGDATFDAPAGRNTPVWIDFYLPEGQRPGEYRGEIEVTSAGNSLRKLPVRLTIWNFTLPRETHLKTVIPTGVEKLRWGFGLSTSDQAGLTRLEDQFFQLAHQHRLNFQPSAEDDVVGEWGGRYWKYLDGSAYTERAGQGTGPNLLIAAPGGEEASEITAYARKTVSWWKGQPERVRKNTALVCYVYDEPHDDEDFAAVAARSSLLRAAVGKELPLFLTTTKPDRVAAGAIDAWGELPANLVARHQGRGEKVWATNQGYAAGPYVDTPGYAGRTQAWMAWKLGLDAWHFWDGCYWIDRQNLRGPDGKKIPTRTINAEPARYLLDTWIDPLTFDQKRNPRLREWIRLNGDGVLFYPGTPAGLREPLASFTMKSLRRGLQDYEYLWLLRQQGKSADDLVSRLVPRANDWAKDPDAWDRTRIELGERLEAAAR